MITIPIWLLVLLIVFTSLFMVVVGIATYITIVMHKRDNREFGEYFNEKYGKKEE